jgi:hypothetical protein
MMLGHDWNIPSVAKAINDILPDYGQYGTDHVWAIGKRKGKCFYCHE